jgi:hypothetical protein
MRKSDAGLRTAALVALVSLSIGCRGSRLEGGRVTAEAGGGPGIDAAVATEIDGAPPPDDAIPSSSGEELSARARHLLEAIARNDAQLATDILFPRDGWLTTRDVSDPGKDWEKRVARPFRHAIRAMGRRHPGLDRARFVSLEMGHAMTQETAHHHAWRKPLWTIRECRLTFVVDGRTHAMSIREMTAWRGAWYVTRLM